MSSGSDQFFEEEDELLAEQAQRPQAKTQQRPSGATPSGRPAPRGSAQQGTPRRGRKPPSFAMAVAIAVVALILGFALGYFVALNTMGERIANDYGEMLELRLERQLHDVAVLPPARPTHLTRDRSTNRPACPRDIPTCRSS